MTPRQLQYSVMSYNIHGVKLYAVESENGYIKMYCDTRKEAQDHVDKINSDA